LLIIYSAFMQKLKFLGNWIVGAGTAFTLIFGASIIGDYSLAGWFALSALLANAGREITKDFEDMKADKGFKKTLPLILGENAKQFVLGIYSASIAIAFFVWFSGITQSIFYLVLIALASAIFFSSAIKLFRNNFIKAQKLSKVGMVVALLAFLASVV
jgi:4-hydroxybenzoate polyprenyltransferase